MSLVVTGNFDDVKDWLKDALTKDTGIKVCKRLCDEYGKEEAQTRYDATPYDGNGEVKVHSYRTRQGWALGTTGEAALFKEFGAGVYYNGSESYPEERPSGVVGIGEYGGRRGRNDWWFYPRANGLGSNGVPSEKYPTLALTHGNPASAAMYHARLRMMDYAQDVFNEEVEKNCNG